MKTISYNPETHRLVPVEPTAEMQEAWGMAPFHEDSDREFRGAYRLMLSAAPVFDTVQETVESEGTELNLVEPVGYMDKRGFDWHMLNNEQTSLTFWRGTDGGKCNTHGAEVMYLYTAPPDYEEIKRQRDVLVKALEWQPIETAPKDGERILLCIDHGQWGDKIWTGLWADGWMVSYGKARTDPTHWMPLPAAPALASVKGETK